MRKGEEGFQEAATAAAATDNHHQGMMNCLSGREEIVWDEELWSDSVRA